MRKRRRERDSYTSVIIFVQFAIFAHNVFDSYHQSRGNRFDRIGRKGGVEVNALCPQGVVFGLFFQEEFRATLGVVLGVVLGIVLGTLCLAFFLASCCFYLSKIKNELAKERCNKVVILPDFPLCDRLSRQHAAMAVQTFLLAVDVVIITFVIYLSHFSAVTLHTHDVTVEGEGGGSGGGRGGGRLRCGADSYPPRRY